MKNAGNTPNAIVTVVIVSLGLYMNYAPGGNAERLCDEERCAKQVNYVMNKIEQIEHIGLPRKKPLVKEGMEKMCPYVAGKYSKRKKRVNPSPRESHQSWVQNDGQQHMTDGDGGHG